MYANPEQISSTVKRSRIGQLIVTVIVLLLIVVYYIGGIKGLILFATSFHPWSSNPYYEQGMDLSEMGDWAAAEEAFTKAATREPNNAEIYRQRSLAKYMQGNEAESLVDLNQSIALEPSAESYLMRSRYFSSKDRAKSDADLQMALQIQPDYFPALVDLIYSFPIENERDNSIDLDTYNLAIQVMPEDTADDIIYTLYASRAAKYIHKKMYKEAFADYRKILEAAPDEAYILALKLKDFQLLLTKFPPGTELHTQLRDIITDVEAFGVVIR